jgi:hypothetical protein
MEEKINVILEDWTQRLDKCNKIISISKDTGDYSTVVVWQAKKSEIEGIVKDLKGLIE